MLVKNLKTSELVEVPTTETEFLKVLQKLTAKFAISYKFGMYDEEDIGQEIAHICLKALPEFDGKHSLYSFLLTRIEWRLNNLKRDEFYRATCPCILCDGKESGDTGHSNRLYCNQFTEWKERNAMKANISAPQSIPSNFDKFIDTKPLDDLCREELIDLIDEKLPMNLRATYLKMKSGIRVCGVERAKVLDFLKTLVGA